MIDDNEYAFITKMRKWVGSYRVSVCVGLHLTLTASWSSLRKQMPMTDHDEYARKCLYSTGQNHKYRKRRVLHDISLHLTSVTLSLVKLLEIRMCCTDRIISHVCQKLAHRYESYQRVRAGLMQVGSVVSIHSQWWFPVPLVWFISKKKLSMVTFDIEAKNIIQDTGAQ